MNIILAIDPGPTESAWLTFDTKACRPVGWAKQDNDEIMRRILRQDLGRLPTVIEMVACYGMPVGKEVFDTAVWIGRYTQALVTAGICSETMTRAQVKMKLCHRTAGVNDSVIRQRLIDFYGGKDKAIGRKATPGPLYGITKDCWAALALAVAWTEAT